MKTIACDVCGTVLDSKTPCMTDIAVTIRAGIGEVVTMEYNIKKWVVPPEDKDNDR